MKENMNYKAFWEFIELLQHEYDHLDGSPALDRQMDNRFVLNHFGKAVHLLAAKQNLPACRTYEKLGYQLC